MWLRAGVLGVLLLLGGLLALVVELPDVASVRTWVDGAGAVGWAALTLGLAVVLLAPVPRSAVSFLVGVMVGFGPGVAVAFSGALLAALAAFGLGRVLGRAAAARLAGARFARVDALVDRRGFVSVLTGRLLPMVPFVVLSYGAGLTAIRWGPYAAGTAVGLVPSTVLQVGAGASVGAIVSGATAWTVVPVLVAAVVVVGLAAGAWRRRQRAAA